MSDTRNQSVLTMLLSELAISGLHGDDSPTRAEFRNHFDHVNGVEASPEHTSTMKLLPPKLAGSENASFAEINGLLSANAEGAQYALRKFQNGLEGYFTASPQGKEDVVGRSWVARPRAFGTFTTARPNVQILRGANPPLVHYNGGTFGTVGTEGTVKEPTTTTLPQQNLKWETTGEGGDMNIPTTTPTPISGRRSTVLGLSKGFRALGYSLGLESQEL